MNCNLSFVENSFSVDKDRMDIFSLLNFFLNNINRDFGYQFVNIKTE